MGAGGGRGGERRKEGRERERERDGGKDGGRERQRQTDIETKRRRDRAGLLQFVLQGSCVLPEAGQCGKALQQVRH